MLLLATGLAFATGGCMRRELKPLNPCLVSLAAESININGVDKVDLLFVVDNSESMLEEQEKLHDEFPKLIETLTGGVRRDNSTFPRARDLHLGVTTTDLGLPGLAGFKPDKCEGGGEDARLLNHCEGFAIPNNASFLSYVAGESMIASEAIGAQFGCLAVVGAEGCGYEMQLDAVLKALWPGQGYETHPVSGAPLLEMPPRFLAFPDQPGGVFGHGGPPGAPTANAGFLRSDPATGQSLIAVVLVTDEDDCSVTDVGVFGEDVPGYPNLRCYENKQSLQPIARYVTGLKALRPADEQLMIFAAIAGVPPLLVTREALRSVDLADATQRDAFYDDILAYPRMVEEPNVDVPQPVLRDACSTPLGGGAKPARRILEVVRGFGANGVIQSICQDSFEPAIDAVIDVIASRLDDVCLFRELVREADGKVDCRVLWELPRPDDPTVAAAAPRACDALPFRSVPPTFQRLSSTGRARCEVPQLPVLDGVDPSTTGQRGWYYDDMSERVQECVGEHKQRIAFTPGAEPPNGVTVQLECLDETQSLPQTRPDVDLTFYRQMQRAPPAIGTRCQGDDRGCALRLQDGTEDQGMFCHRQQNVCVRSCASDADCPPAWVCDPRPETAEQAGGEDLPAQRICVNPTCGTR